MLHKRDMKIWFVDQGLEMTKLECNSHRHIGVNCKWQAKYNDGHCFVWGYGGNTVKKMVHKVYFAKEKLLHVYSTTISLFLGNYPNCVLQAQEQAQAPSLCNTNFAGAVTHGQPPLKKRGMESSEGGHRCIVASQNPSQWFLQTIHRR